MIAYESEVDGAESHVALVYGDVGGDSGGEDAEPILVRVHTHCLAGDVFATTLCNCRDIVDSSLRMIAGSGRGALIYLHNGHRGFAIDRLQPALLPCPMDFYCIAILDRSRRARRKARARIVHSVLCAR